MRTRVILLSVIGLLSTLASTSAQTTPWPFPDTLNFSFTIHGSLTTHEHYGNAGPGFPSDTTFTSGSVLDEPYQYYAPISPIIYETDSVAISSNHWSFSLYGDAPNGGYHDIGIYFAFDTINHRIDTFDFREDIDELNPSYTTETSNLELRNIQYDKDSLFFTDDDIAMHFDFASYFTSELLNADHTAYSNTSGFGVVDSITIFGHTLYRTQSGVKSIKTGLKTFSFMPTIADGHINLQFPSSDGSLSVYNILGQQLYFEDRTVGLNGSNMTIDTRSWPNGTYIITYSNAHGSAASKFIVRH